MLLVRKSLAYLLSSFLLVIILLGVLAFNLNSHFAKPSNLETWLSQSNIYNHFVSEVISQSKQSIGGGSQSSSISLSDATVQQAAQNAFSPQLLQTSVNSFLDANYAWLQGKTAKPEFTIDLSQAKQSFATQVGQYAQARFSSLPVCTAAQLAQLQSVDPLSAPCRPAGVSAAAEGANVTQQLATSGDFLSNPVITADNFQPKNTSSKPYYQRLSFAPKVYRWSSRAPAILGGLAVLLAAAIIFLLPRRKGLRRVAITLIFGGILLVLTKFASDYVFKKVQAKAFNSSNIGQLQQSLTDVLHRAQSALASTDLYFGIGLIVAGVIIVAVLILTRDKQPKAPKAAPDAGDTAADPEAITTESPQAQGPQPPKSKRAKLVQ